MINDVITFKCEGMTAPELAETVTEIGSVGCPDHGEKLSYKPATGASFDKESGTYRGSCRVSVSGCCKKLVNIVQVGAM